MFLQHFNLETALQMAIIHWHIHSYM